MAPERTLEHQVADALKRLAEQVKALQQVNRRQRDAITDLRYQLKVVHKRLVEMRRSRDLWKTRALK